MKVKHRLLFLAYDFPPINTIGSVRAYNIAKWLTRKGWEVTVVTPHESAWKLAGVAMDLHEDLSRQGIRCMRTEHRWRSLLPVLSERRKYGLAWAAGGVSRRIAAFFGIERETGWIREAAKACVGLTPEDVDVVFASGPPFASFGLARRVAERLGRPYVMDYRDLWTGNPHAKHSAPQRMIESERDLLAASAAATGVSPSLLDSLKEQFGIRKALHVISNGFDPAEMAGIPKHDFGQFAIVYAGMFYPPKRTAGPLMAALRRVEQLDGKRRQWAFHYYGYQGEYVLRSAREFNVEHRVVIHGNVPRAEALSAVRGANVAVVISSVYEQGSLQDRGIVTGKVFEAIGLGTPLLVIAPEGSDLEGILAVTGCGKRFAGTEIDRIAGFLQDALNGGTPVDFSPESFSWTNIAEQLDGVLRAAVGANG
jgi:glycosyltransferase involved in cell wall biosynthesis